VDAPALDPGTWLQYESAVRRAAAYGADAVKAEERERAQRRAVELDRYRKALL